jgi:hypothetical protein
VSLSVDTALGRVDFAGPKSCDYRLQVGCSIGDLSPFVHVRAVPLSLCVVVRGRRDRITCADHTNSPLPRRCHPGSLVSTSCSNTYLQRTVAPLTVGHPSSWFSRSARSDATVRRVRSRPRRTVPICVRSDRGVASGRSRPTRSTSDHRRCPASLGTGTATEGRCRLSLQLYCCNASAGRGPWALRTRADATREEAGDRREPRPGPAPAPTSVTSTTSSGSLHNVKPSRRSTLRHITCCGYSRRS